MTENKCNEMLERLEELEKCTKCHKARNCGDPGKLTNGVVSGSNFTVGSVVSYRCENGYSLIGNPTRICLSSGRWNGTAPTCQPTDVKLLEKPHLELSITGSKITHVAALPQGGALVADYDNLKERVTQINKDGGLIREVYSCQLCLDITGLFEMADMFNVLHSRAAVLKFGKIDVKPKQVYQTPDVAWVTKTGSPTNGFYDPKILLLVDKNNGEVFSYNISSRVKRVHVTGLNQPRTVSYLYYNSAAYFIVCETGENVVKVYSSSWNFLWNIRGNGTEQLDIPKCAIPSPDGRVIIADTGNNRVSLFGSRASLFGICLKNPRITCIPRLPSPTCIHTCGLSTTVN